MARTAAIVTALAASAGALVAPVAAPARAAPLAAMSKSLPFLTEPKGLTGYLGAEAGFDPMGFAEIMDIKWMREAEIKHGRVSMLAIIGYTYPEMPWFQQAFPGDAYFRRADIPQRRVAARPRSRRGHSSGTSRGAAAAATWIFLGDDGCDLDLPWRDGSQRGRGRDADLPRRRVAATPRVPRG